MTFRGFDVECANGTRVTLSTFTTSDGKLEQFLRGCGGLIRRSHGMGVGAVYRSALEARARQRVQGV